MVAIAAVDAYVKSKKQGRSNVVSLAHSKK
jgi:hypothetical protein